ncbi:AtpZ/AtpI family protein [Humitalea sp. 24SJ18S-53]|uniref:AtpZ/AtpI family protein n=1 Tax=Humitalea sp. 24SJ18S-53 TaxID=3422307 RepID=UPI003D66A67F
MADEFDDRLRKARTRHGLDVAKDGDKGGALGPWGFGLRAGVELVSSLMVGAGLGYLLDRWLGTSPWLLMVMILVGGAAGVMNIYRLFMPPKRPTL